MKRLACLLLLSPLALAACEVSKSENPLSPTLAGPIPGVEISAPKLLEPGNGQMIAGNQQPLTLLLENASSNSPRPLNYVFEVATDANFGNKVFSREGIQPGDDGRTSLRLPDALGSGQSYFWRAKAQDGANTGPYSDAIRFNVFTPVGFDRPGPVSPVGNTRVDTATPEFVFNNAPHVGSPQSIVYVIEISTSDGFGSPIAWSVNEQPNVTKLTAPSGLLMNTQYFWRVRAHDGGTVGPWSDTQVFRTPVPVVVAPTPGPSGPSVPSGAPCYTLGNAEQIVQCRRSQYGHMSQGEIVAMLRGVASDLNKAGIGDGPFGILRKGGGSNCGGYSCDIICSGQGTSQKQWDVLGDAEGAQGAYWPGSPHTYPDIRVDTCEIQ
jgi:hypothetical protein